MRHGNHPDYYEVRRDNVLDLLNSADPNEIVAALTVVHVCEWRWCEEAVIVIAADETLDEDVSMYAAVVLAVLTREDAIQ